MLPYIIIKASSSSSAGSCLLPKGVPVPVAGSKRGYIGTPVPSFCAPDTKPPAKKVPKLKDSAAKASAPAAAPSGLGLNNSL